MSFSPKKRSIPMFPASVELNKEKESIQEELEVLYENGKNWLNENNGQSENT